jgi:hypothetical protein
VACSKIGRLLSEILAATKMSTTASRLIKYKLPDVSDKTTASSTLKEALKKGESESTETLIMFYQTTRRGISEDLQSSVCYNRSIEFKVQFLL